MIRIRIADLESARTRKPTGYFEDVLGSGAVTDGVLFIEDARYKELQQKYSSEPTFTQKLSNAAGAATRVIQAKSRGQLVTVSTEEHARRMAICSACEFFNGKTCSKCGCVARWKTKLATEKCPVGKW